MAGRASLSDPALILVALFANNVATMARVRRSLHRERIATKFLMPLYIKEMVGGVEDLRNARLYWTDTLDMLTHLAQVWDRMVVHPRKKQCTLSRNVYQRFGMWRGSYLYHLHEMYRLPALHVRRARREQLQVLALVY